MHHRSYLVFWKDLSHPTRSLPCPSLPCVPGEGSIMLSVLLARPCGAGAAWCCLVPGYELALCRRRSVSAVGFHDPFLTDGFLFVSLFLLDPPHSITHSDPNPALCVCHPSPSPGGHTLTAGQGITSGVSRPQCLFRRPSVWLRGRVWVRWDVSEDSASFCSSSHPLQPRDMPCTGLSSGGGPKSCHYGHS